MFWIKVQEPYPQPSGGQKLGALEVLPDLDRYINTREAGDKNLSLTFEIGCKSYSF